MRLIIGFILLVVVHGVYSENWWYEERPFNCLQANAADPTLYDVLVAGQKLMPVAGPFVVTNEAMAVEYDALAVSSNAQAAWNSAVDGYLFYGRLIYSNCFARNPGWVRGKREWLDTEGHYSAHIYYLKNTGTFVCVTNRCHVSVPGGSPREEQISSVLVGTLGDMTPYKVLRTEWPMLDTNVPNSTDETIFYADTRGFYKLAPAKYMPNNDGDSDGDGIPDYADGYDYSVSNTNDDLSAGNYLIPWHVIVSPDVDMNKGKIKFEYAVSDPIRDMDATRTIRRGALRIWTQDANQPRNGRNVLQGGDFVSTNEYRLSDLGFAGSRKIKIFYLEGVKASTQAGMTVKMDPQGKNQYRATETWGVTIIKVDIAETNVYACFGCTNHCDVTLHLTNSYLAGGTAEWYGGPNNALLAVGSTATFDPTSWSPSNYTITARSTLLTNCLDTCHLTVLKVEVKKPTGDPDSTNNASSVWLSSPCYHWDFQGVATICPTNYALDVEGDIQPAGFSYGWTTDTATAVGTLTGTGATPTHNPPSTASEYGGQGNFKLEAMDGTTATGCTNQTDVIIYVDHLGRDKKNFGTSKSCEAGTWDTPFGDLSMSKWNCHGSTWHHYNGTGNGLAVGIPPVGAPKRTVIVTHQAGGGGSHPPLGPLVRGDIVAYYMAADFDGDGNPDLMHSQTCTGNGTRTYGANNETMPFPGAPANQSWKWEQSTAGDWANNLWLPGTGVMPVTIKVYSKP